MQQPLLSLNALKRGLPAMKFKSLITDNGLKLPVGNLFILQPQQNLNL